MISTVHYYDLLQNSSNFNIDKRIRIQLIEQPYASVSVSVSPSRSHFTITHITRIQSSVHLDGMQKNVGNWFFFTAFSPRTLTLRLLKGVAFFPFIFIYFFFFFFWRVITQQIR